MSVYAGERLRWPLTSGDGRGTWGRYWDVLADIGAIYITSRHTSVKTAYLNVIGRTGMQRLLWSAGRGADWASGSHRDEIRHTTTYGASHACMPGLGVVIGGRNTNSPGTPVAESRDGGESIVRRTCSGGSGLERAGMSGTLRR